MVRRAERAQKSDNQASVKKRGSELGSMSNKKRKNAFVELQLPNRST